MSDTPDTPPGGSDGTAEENGAGDAPASGAIPGVVDPDDDVIDEAGQESFPASDSPSSWAGPPSASR